MATDEGIREVLSKIGRSIGDALPDGWGFALLVFEYGERGRCDYISSAQRADVAKVLRQMADQLDRQIGAKS